LSHTRERRISKRSGGVETGEEAHQESDFPFSCLRRSIPCSTPLALVLQREPARRLALIQIFYHHTEFSGGDHETRYNRAYEEWPSSVRQFLVERRLDEWKLQLFIVILLTQRK